MMVLRPYFLSLQWVLLFLIFNPFFLSLLGTSFDTYDLQRITELLLFASTTLHLSTDTEFRRHSFQFLENICSYKKILLSAFFIWGLLSASHAVFPRYALMEIATFYLWLIFMLSIAGWYSLQKEDFIRNFIFFILFCFTVSAIGAVLSFVYARNNIELFMPDIYIYHQMDYVLNFLASPGFMNRRFFDDIQVFLIPLLIGFYFAPSFKRWQKILIFLLISYSYTRGILDGSRVYIYESLALIFILPFIFRKRATPFLCLLIAAYCVGFVIYFLVYKLGLSAIDFHLFGQANSLVAGHGRVLLWEIAARLILLHPFFGVGPLHYGLHAFAAENYAAHPHSAILVIASEWGIPALIFLLVVVISAIYDFTQKMLALAKTPSAINNYIGLTGALIGGLIMMLIDGLILMPAGQMMLALTAGWALAKFYDYKTNAPLICISKRFSSWLIALLVIALIVVAWGIYPAIVHNSDINSAYFESCVSDCGLSPDYWSQGFIQFY